MNVGLYRAASGMAANQRRLDAIAANLANVDTVSYKRRKTATHEFEVKRGARAERRVRGLGTTGAVDWSQGNLNRTGRTLDLALFGQGFLAVESPDGEVFTRDGRLRMSPDGDLLTADGFPLIWNELNGSIDPRGLPIVIDREGNVNQGEQTVGRLRLVDFEPKQGLRQDGLGYWIAPPGVREVAYTAEVHQGALEGSNTAGLEEMIELITLQRSYEVSARVLTMIDRTYQRLNRPT